MITTSLEIQIAIQDLTRLIQQSKPIDTTGIDYQNVMTAIVDLKNAIDEKVKFE
jgi:hypothetical protein